MREEILGIAEIAVRHAERQGAEQAEAFVASTRSFTIEVENNSIKSAAERCDSGCGIRCVIDSRIGFAYVTTIREEDVRAAVERAISLAHVSVPDPDFGSLPSASGGYPVVERLYDRAMANLSSEEAADIVTRMVDATKESLSDYKYAIEAQMRTSRGGAGIVNSLGIEAYYEGTTGYIYSAPTIKTEDEQTSSSEYELARALREFDPEKVGREAAAAVIANLGGRRIENDKMPVVFGPIAVGSVLGGGFGGAVNAEEVQFGRSYVADALGQQIASEHLTIVDDALSPGEVSSRPFDGEGVPSRRIMLLEQGVLKSLLHNSYTAQKDQVENTAHASRSSYSSPPRIAPSNLIVQPGRGGLMDLVEEVGRGILCRDTGDRPNMTTGDLSALVMEGYYFENGEIRYPVKSTLIGINMLDLLRRVILVGGDVRRTSEAITPSIVVEQAQITSG